MRTLGVVLVALALTLGAPVQAGSVAYKDTTGAWLNFGAGATWDNLQTAITTAQGGGGGGRGEVRIEGNITRTALDVTTAGLSIAGVGAVDVSGGWDAVWTTRNYTTQSVLDTASNTLAVKGRVMSVSTANVTLGNVQIKNGYTGAGSVDGLGLLVNAAATGLRVSNSIISNNTSSDNVGSGIGVYVAANDVKLTSTVVTDNNSGGGYAGGAGVGVRITAGTVSAPVVLEYCTISRNTGGSYSAGYGNGVAVTGTGTATIANSRITANAYNGSGQNGTAIYMTGNKLTVFGTLIDSQPGLQYWGANPATIYVNQPSTTTEPLVMANCTVVDNGLYGRWWNTPLGSGATDQNLTLLSNTIVATTSSASVDNLIVGDNNSRYAHMLLQNSSVSSDDAPTVKVAFAANVTTLPDLSDALSTQVSGARYRFQSIDAAGNLVVNPGAAANMEVDLKNLGADNLVDPNPANWTYKYQLKVNDADVNSGTLKDAGGVYQYIDINHNGAFDQNTDIVVGGTPPVGSLFVYKYDVSVLNALQSGRYYLQTAGTDVQVWDRVLATQITANRIAGTIDRGAYEAADVGVYWLGDTTGPPRKWSTDTFDDAAADAATTSASTVLFDERGLTQAVSVEKGTGTGPTAGTVRFGGTAAYTLTSPDGAVLNMQAAAGSAYLLSATTGANNTINCDVNLVSNLIADMGASGWGVIVNGNIVGAGTLTKDGTGTLRINGAANNYPGTIVNSGTLDVGVANLFTGSNTLTINGGVVQLNGNNQDMGATALTMSGGFLNGTATITRTNDYTLGGGTVNAILGEPIATPLKLIKNTAGTLTLNNVNNSYTNGTRVDLGILAFGANVPAAGNSVVGSGTFTLNGGTLGAGAAGLVFSRDIAVTANSFLAGSGGLSFTVAGNLTGGAFTVELPTGFANAVTLSGTGGSLSGSVRVTAGTLLLGANVPAAGNSIVGTNTLLLNGGTLAAAIAGLDCARNIQLTAVQPLSSTIGGTNNFLISGAISQDVAGRILTKTGTNVVELTGTNTYTGQTQLMAGIIRAVDGVGLAPNSNIWINNGIIESKGTFTRATGAGATQIQWAALGYYPYSGGSGGFAAKGGTLTITFNNDPTVVKTWGAGGFVPSGQTLVFGSVNADNLVEFTNKLDLNNAARTVQVNDNTASAGDYARMSGSITSATPASGALTKTGTGTLELTGFNAYTGVTTITAGALRAVDGTGLPAQSVLTFNGGVFETTPGVFNRNLTTLTTGGGVRWSASGGFSANSGPLLIQLNAGTAEVTWNVGGFVPTGQTLIFGCGTSDNVVDFQNGIDLNNAVRTVQVNDNPLSPNDYARLSGTIRSSVGAAGLTKTGNGLLELTGPCTYTGVTTVSAGTLRVLNSMQGSVSVSATGRLAGIGPVNGFTVALNGIVGPGASPGTLYSNAAVQMNTGSIYEYEINTATVHDLVAVTGNLTLQDNWILRLMDYGGNGIGPTDQLDVFTYTNTLSAHLAVLKLDRVTIDTSLLNPLLWDTSGVGLYSDPTGRRIYLTGLAFTGAVPEPAALGILLLGLPLVIRRRRA